MRIVRVKYGKKGTPLEMREYQIEGAGPVGCISEYEKLFPDEELEIIDEVENG